MKTSIILVFVLFLAVFIDEARGRKNKHLKLLHKVCDLNSFCYEDEEPFVVEKEDDTDCPAVDDELPKPRKNRIRNTPGIRDRIENGDSGEFEENESEFREVSKLLSNCTEVISRFHVWFG